MTLEVVMLIMLTLLAFLAMPVLHYIAPRVMGPRELSRLETYSLGVGVGIVLPFTTWCLLWPMLTGREAISFWWPPVALAVIVAGAGFGTLAAWGADSWAGTKVKARANRGKSQ